MSCTDFARDVCLLAKGFNLILAVASLVALKTPRLEVFAEVFIPIDRKLSAGQLEEQEMTWSAAGESPSPAGAFKPFKLS